jgi:hypothetical protein
MIGRRLEVAAPEVVSPVTDHPGHLRIGAARDLLRIGGTVVTATAAESGRGDRRRGDQGDERPSQSRPSRRSERSRSASMRSR